MAKSPPKDPPGDPRVADLARYRKQREADARKKPPKPTRPPAGRLVGSNPYAGWILLALAAVLVLVFGLPLVMRLL